MKPNVNTIFWAMEALAEGCEGVTCDLLRATYGPNARLVKEEASDWIFLVGADANVDIPVLRISLFRTVDWRVTRFRGTN